jgi:hypothetical protein
MLADSKTGKKTIVLNAPALAVLNSLDRIGQYVIAGEKMDQPRADLNRPWNDGLDGDIKTYAALLGRGARGRSPEVDGS